MIVYSVCGWQSLLASFALLQLLTYKGAYARLILSENKSLLFERSPLDLIRL